MQIYTPMQKGLFFSLGLMKNGIAWNWKPTDDRQRGESQQGLFREYSLLHPGFEPRNLWNEDFQGSENRRKVRFQEFMACFVGEKFYSLWLGLRIRNSTIYDFFTGERSKAQESRRKSKGHCFWNFLFFFTILFRSSATTRRKQSREADFYNPSCREEETERL